MFLKRINEGPKLMGIRRVRCHWKAILEYLMIVSRIFEFRHDSGSEIVPKRDPFVIFIFVQSLA